MTDGLIRLFIVDVDGTLLTPDKVLTDDAANAIRDLRQAGVKVALTSGRPPRGLRMLVEPLAIDTPLAAFNGGMFARPDLTVLAEHTLEPDAARAAAALIRDHGLDLWVYRGTKWYVRDLDAPHVDKEQSTVEFPPVCTEDIDSQLDGAVKIVGVSDDLQAVERCEADAQKLDSEISAARSQPYYLDVTHPNANKGAVVEYLSRHLGVPPEEIATIGDMPNDVRMFEVSRLSIAMGNASREVQQQAHHVTASNTEEGFARAAVEIILPRAPHNERTVRGR